MTAIYGCDPSLTSFGISNGTRHETISTPAGVPIGDRVRTIVAEVARFVTETAGPATKIVFVVEAPLLSSATGSGHLYELGWLMCWLENFERDLRAASLEVVELLVPSPTLRKWAVGKGNVPKADMKLQVFKKFGVEFDRDPGADKLFAFLLHCYGCAVVAGELEHAVSAARGKGKDARREQRKGARTKGLTSTGATRASSEGGLALGLSVPA